MEKFLAETVQLREPATGQAVTSLLLSIESGGAGMFEL